MFGKKNVGDNDITIIRMENNVRWQTYSLTRSLPVNHSDDAEMARKVPVSAKGWSNYHD